MIDIRSGTKPLLFSFRPNTNFRTRSDFLPVSHLPEAIKLALLGLVLSLQIACVYEIDVQQGNKLEPQDVEAVQVGMTRNQVRYILCTPAVTALFTNDRWDYVYYFRAGRSRTPEQRWLTVWFDGNVVREIEKDIPTQPAS